MNVTNMHGTNVHWTNVHWTNMHWTNVHGTNMHWTNLYWKWKIVNGFFSIPGQALYINVNTPCQIDTSFGSDFGRGCNRLMQTIMLKTPSSKPKYSSRYVGLHDKDRCRLQELGVRIYRVPLHKMANGLHRTAETTWSVIYGLTQFL